MSLDHQFQNQGDAAAEPPPKVAKNRRRGGCLKKIAIFLLLVIPLAIYLLNGPGFRWLAAFGIRKGAETQGLTGTVLVKGSILSGFHLEKADFTGDGSGMIESLSVDKARVDYSLKELIQDGGLGWLHGVQLFGVDSRIVLEDPAGEKETETEDEPAEGSEEKDLSEIVSQLLAVDYDLREISVHVTRGEKIYQVDDFALRLPAGKTGNLSIGRLEIPGTEPREAIETEIGVTPESVTLGPLRILDPIEVTTLNVQNWLEPKRLAVNAEVLLSGGDVVTTYAGNGVITATLKGGEISLPELLALADFQDLEAGTLTALNVDFQGDFGVPATWDSNLALGLSGLQWKTYRADEVTLKAALDSAAEQPERLELKVRRKGTSVEARAATSFAETATPADLANLPAGIEASFQVDSVAEVLAEFVPDLKEKIPAEGSVNGNLKMDLADKDLVQTHVALQSDTLTYDGVPIDSVRLIGDLEKRKTLALDADVSLDPGTVLAADGAFDLESFAYRGKADLSTAITDRLTKLLGKFAFTKKLDGAATLAWKGSGEPKEKKHRGEATLAAEGVRFEEAEVFDATLQGSYDDQLNIDLPAFQLTSELLQARGALTYRDAILDLREFQLHSDELLLLEGKLKTPLNPAVARKPADFFAQKGPLEIDIVSHGLALESVLGLFQQAPPVNCLIGIDLKASGSPSDLELAGAFTADRIVATPGKNAVLDEKVEPARVVLNLAVADSVARLSGKLEQTQIQPFILAGSMPFVPAQWIEGGRDIKKEPVQFSASMKESDLGVLTAFAPAVSEITGSADIDFSMGGTLGEPIILGAANLRAKSIRFASKKAPSVRDFSAAVRFEESTVHLDQFDAILAGGRVGMKGTVGLGGGAPPEFDLRLGGQEVLAFRSDSLSLRTDLNLSLKGPYPAATLAGTIGITSSLFYKDIDLLPSGGIGFGGEKSSLPPVEPGAKMPLPKSLEVGVPIEPFRDWKVDLRILTLDPFRVAGNLAQASANCDLAISNTLGAPVPNGRVWIDQARIKLPFSRVELSEGEVRFNEVSGFNGELALKAISRISDHRVTIFVHNRMLDPKLVFTSIPPLPREDILSLIASGATREQLTDGGGTAATKALLYSLKGLRNKEGRVDPDAPPSFADTLEERTDVSVGAADPDTGELRVDTRVRLWRDSYFGLSMGNEGSYRGILGYIFRFR